MSSLAENNSTDDLIGSMAADYGMERKKFLETVQNAIFSNCRFAPSDEQILSLLNVVDHYGLHLFTRQVWAMQDRGGNVIPVISIDGWVSIMNNYLTSNGVTFVYSEEMVTMDTVAKPCHAWVECQIHRKDREHPVCIREYLDELYRPAAVKNGKTFPGPWQTCPKRMLRHKALIQGIRIGYGLSGIYDQDEAEKIIEHEQMQETGIIAVDGQDPAAEEKKARKRKSPAKKAKPKSEDTPDPEAPVAEPEAVDNAKPDEPVVESDNGINPKVQVFIDNLVKRARQTGAFAAAVNLAQERLVENKDALSLCMSALDQAEIDWALQLKEDNAIEQTEEAS